MQADFSRRTFDPLKHFSAVLAQQGRVQLDADANEQAAILLHQLRTVVTDLVGPAAAADGGFRIEPELDARNATILDLDIAAGRCYVDGTMVENPARSEGTTYWNQPDGHLDPEQDRLPETGPFIVYLRVWERLITALQDPAIREVALGAPGPDTAARAKTVWQVAWCPGDSLGDFSSFRRSLNPAPGRLAARAKRPDDADDDICHLPPEARFRGPENQLYRVEVHTGGRAWQDSVPANGKTRRDDCPDRLSGATFKWSRENASVVFPVVAVSGATVTLATLGRDGKMDLDIGDYVELVDDATACRVADDVPIVQRPNPAPKLRQVVAIDPADRLVTLDSEVDDRCGPGTDPDLHPLLRRWDHPATARYEDGTRDVAVDGALPLVEDTWIDLEDGVQVCFDGPSASLAVGLGGSYRRGDYWQIPARTITGDVEWPQDDDGPRPLRPHGVEYHYAVLGIIGAGGQVTDRLVSFEPFFPKPGAVPGTDPADPPAADSPSPAPRAFPGSPEDVLGRETGPFEPEDSAAGVSPDFPATGGAGEEASAGSGVVGGVGGDVVAGSPEGGEAGMTGAAVPDGSPMLQRSGAVGGGSPVLQPVVSASAGSVAMGGVGGDAVAGSPKIGEAGTSGTAERDGSPILQPAVPASTGGGTPAPPVLDVPPPAVPGPVGQAGEGPGAQVVTEPEYSSVVSGPASRPDGSRPDSEAADWSGNQVVTEPENVPATSAPVPNPDRPPRTPSPDSVPRQEDQLSPPAPTTAVSADGIPGGFLGNQLTSWLRTVVPGIWAAIVAWLVTLGLPASATDWLSGLGNQVLVPLVLALVYALLRGLEPAMPPWLTRLLLGSNRPPAYAPGGTAAVPPTVSPR
ncbi:hypothetical protein ATK36_5947 [Amycolatopsis sulphurea]|uniref:Uncharacterized protein n=1 Tax=Amycolatopsis sulphurea TaxID=76022 RepID=A0A2A9FJG4_9PSEU|nr:DUF6519 domain-containing protein [Amycolatopsis sulphurea]PFG50702.1 hypothetical protein ATK36_5947 [Amycolatopsis sulphurea]